MSDALAVRVNGEARSLPRKAAMLYAGESMRVTTRLMQAASWLLIQRAVQEGDMTAEDAASDRYRLGAKEICMGKRADGVEALPGFESGEARERLHERRADHALVHGIHRLDARVGEHAEVL